jgi:hypothetical protein
MQSYLNQFKENFMDNTTENIHWKLICEQFTTANMSKRQFCKTRNISESQLYYYLYKFKPEAIQPISKKKKEKVAKKITSFLPVKYKPAETKQELKLTLKTGHILSFEIPTDQIPSFIQQIEHSHESSL